MTPPKRRRVVIAVAVASAICSVLLALVAYYQITLLPRMTDAEIQQFVQGEIRSASAITIFPIHGSERGKGIEVNDPAERDRLAASFRVVRLPESPIYGTADGCLIELSGSKLREISMVADCVRVETLWSRSAPYASEIGFAREVEKHTPVRLMPDIIDPVVLSRMPPTQLRDAELEFLIRAAFRKARLVELSARKATDGSRHIEVSDERNLEDLANSFAVGRDASKLPNYRDPRLSDVRVTFTGPYQPNFQFVGDKEIQIAGSEGNAARRLPVQTEFGKTVALFLNLTDQPVSREGSR